MVMISVGGSKDVDRKGSVGIRWLAFEYISQDFLVPQLLPITSSFIMVPVL